MQIGHRISGEALWVVAGVVISMGIALAGTRFLTTVLSPAEFGRLVLMVSLAGLFDQVIGHAIGGAAMRFYSIYHFEHRLGELKAVVFRYLLTSALICVVGVMLVASMQWFAIDLLLVLTLVFSIALLVSGVGVRLVEGARLRQISASFRTSFEFLRFGFAALLIYFGSNTAESAMGGFMVGAGIVACIHWYYIRINLVNRNEQSNGSENQLAESFRKYAAPLLLVGFGTWVFLMSPLWALGWFCDIEEVGVYGAYHQLAFIPMLVISGLLLTYLAPIVYEKTIESPDKVMEKSFKLIVMTFISIVLIAVIAYFWHQYFAIIFLGEQFRSNSWMLPLLIIAGGFYGISQQLLLKLRVEMRILKLAIIQLIFALIALVFYAVTAKVYAVDGMVYAVVILNTLLMIAAYIFTGIYENAPEAS